MSDKNALVSLECTLEAKVKLEMYMRDVGARDYSDAILMLLAQNKNVPRPATVPAKVALVEPVHATPPPASHVNVAALPAKTTPGESRTAITTTTVVYEDNGAVTGSECRFCGGASPTIKCPRCNVWYCDAQCQYSHTRNHKKECK
jgi:hypothetical protein